MIDEGDGAAVEKAEASRERDGPGCGMSIDGTRGPAQMRGCSWEVPSPDEAE